MYRPCLLLTLFCLAPLAFAANMPNYLADASVGSWVTTEERIQRGKKTEIVQVTRSLVGEETIDGKRHLWMEVKTQNYKTNRKGELKTKGDMGHMKILMDTSVFDGSFTSGMKNIQKIARKMYIKNGDQVMDMSGGGALADMLMKASNAEFNFQTTDLGESREFDTPLGQVTAHKYRAVGGGQMKVLIKTVKIQSEIDMWMSDKIPFGTVESHGTSVVNGKSETSTSRILAAGNSGAVSEIDISQAAENPFSKLKFGK